MGTKEILYKLIQVSLGSISTFDLPKEVDWNGLVDVSLEQGVCPVAFDGFNKLKKVVYRHAFWIVPLSTGMYRNIVARVRTIEDKITVIPNISELNRFSNWTPTISFPFFSRKKKILLYCGTIGKVNGFLYLVDLVSKTIKYNKNIIYCIFGKGNELDIILQKTKEANVFDKNFFYLGVVSKTDLPYLYHVVSAGSSFVINNSILWGNSANKFLDA